MNSELVLKYSTLLFVLLNPFLLSIYLLELIHSLKTHVFAYVLIRGSLIAGVVYSIFAVFGETIFESVLQVRFASFLIFGGIIFLLVGIRFVFGGVRAVYEWRGTPSHLAGAIAMPFLIGPATISASVMMGQELEAGLCIAIIAGVLILADALLIFFKWLYDYLSERNEKLIKAYVEIIGRITALYVGIVSIEMILRGIELWLKQS